MLSSAARSLRRCMCLALAGSTHRDRADSKIYRRLGTHATQEINPSMSSETGKSIAVIGAGPAGLAAAALLKRYGHHVTIYEGLSRPGGTALYGIPDYHLPKDVLSHEINKIKDMGIEINAGISIGKDITLSYLRDESD